MFERLLFLKAFEVSEFMLGLMMCWKMKGCWQCVCVSLRLDTFRKAGFCWTAAAAGAAPLCWIAQTHVDHRLRHHSDQKLSVSCYRCRVLNCVRELQAAQIRHLDHFKRKNRGHGSLRLVRDNRRAPLRFLLRAPVWPLHATSCRATEIQTLNLAVRIMEAFLT